MLHAISRGLAVAMLLCLGLENAAQAGLDYSTTRPAKSTSIADFESAAPEGTQSGNVEVKIVVDSRQAASGTGCLQIRILDNTQDAYVIFPLPAGASIDPQSKLVASIRRTDRGKPVRMHWFALDGDNWVIFQRQFQYDGDGEWVKMEWPLSQWRWGNERAGDWIDVRSLVLRLESEVSELYMDDLGLAEIAGEDAFREEFLRKTAFNGRKNRVAVADGFLAGTDATADISTDDLKEMIGQMKRVREWCGRIFGDSARPMTEGPPVALLVFSRRDDYLAFFKRLGEHWNVDIAPPRGGGYTVQDISACVYDAGAVRGQPVALHESVHAVVSRQLRLLPGAPAHAWLQEGLGNYIQLCVYPRSLPEGEYAKNFGRPIGPGTFFRPLDEIIGGPVSSKHYAQLASLAAWLVQEKPELLRAIARGLAEGEELPAILKAQRTSLAQMEKQWFEWGRGAYVIAEPAASGPARHFPLPREWR
jgi:hypothetical protein